MYISNVIIDHYHRILSKAAKNYSSHE